MPIDKKYIKKSIEHIKVNANINNEIVSVSGESKYLKCIGIGTDAAVFHFIEYPKYAIKIFTEEGKSKVEIEKTVYDRLGENKYFSKCYDYGENYLIISYEEGITLFDCIIKGIHISEDIIREVEMAREYVRSVGLNPRDIHLKNIILQNGHAKIIDVAEYVKTGNDNRWEHLKYGYEKYYHLIDGKSVPFWIVETVRKWYKQGKIKSIDDFADFIVKIFSINK